MSADVFRHLGDEQDALRTYLRHGAPLGHEDEVREFLGSRKTQVQR